MIPRLLARRFVKSSTGPVTSSQAEAWELVRDLAHRTAWARQSGVGNAAGLGVARSRPADGTYGGHWELCAFRLGSGPLDLGGEALVGFVCRGKLANFEVGVHVHGVDVEVGGVAMCFHVTLFVVGEADLRGFRVIV